jgi:tetratricopeptide (TPR) repeat protein
MMTTPERHYDDASLIFLMESGRNDDPHLVACAQCADSVAQYLAIREVLGEDAVWDLRDLNEDPVPQTIANLRAFATDMAYEDAAAEAIVASLLAGNRETWMPRLRQHPEWRTAGVVRRLIAATDKAFDTMPLDAVEITALGVEIVDHLDTERYSSETVLKLRGAAWRERAYALSYVGEFRPAMEAVSRASDFFAKTIVDEYDRARVELIRAWIVRALEQTREALQVTRRSATTFASFGDQARLNVARETEAAIHHKNRDFDAAIAIWHELEQNLPATELHTRGMYLQNLAHAYRELRDYSRAQSHFEFAIDAFQALGVESNAARARRHIGVTLMAAGRYAEALTFLSNLCYEFERLGMRDEAVVASLDRAEALLLLGRNTEVVETCQELSRQFEARGLEQTSGALTAIAYLREAVEAGRCTPAVVEHVRDYVRRSETHQQLLFLPLPE